MNNQAWLDRYKQVMVPNYAPLPCVPVRGEGSRLWDAEGKEYIDFTGGVAVNGLGHAHPELQAVLLEQGAKLWHVSNYFANTEAIELAEMLTEATFAEKVFFANSGAEANEAALKMARRYAHQHFGAQKDRIIAFQKSFHGRTLFSVTAGGTDAYKQGFGPLPPKVEHLAHNNLAALEELMGDDCCALIMEPILAEGGIHALDPAFAQGVRRLCSKHQVLLVLDEVQTGMGRTGDLFCYQSLGFTPDILTTAKSLGGGFPISALMTTTKIAEVFQPGTHGCTFGGNPLGCALAKKTLSLINQPATLQGVREKGARLVAGLQAINQRIPLFAEIRGKGLLIGCELKPEHKAKTKTIHQKAVDHGLLLLMAGPEVLRLAPSLLISNNEIDQGLARLEQVLKEV